MKKKLFIALFMFLSLVCLASCQQEDKGMKMTIWVSEVPGMVDLTNQQLARFEEETGIDINAKVSGVSEADAATLMITDVATGADIFCFAQDQLARLVQAGALSKLGNAATTTVKEANDASSVKAATVSGDLYAYPLTSDNGYFMYYDKSVFEGVDMNSLEAIVARCEETDTQFSFDCVGNGWYIASFFFATGCVSNWTMDESGKFTSVEDTYNSAAGITALKGMQKLVKSPAWNGSADGSTFATGSSVVVSGTWDATKVQEILGDNFAATKLPSFTVDGTTYQLGSFSGNKLMGVKPQTDAERTSVLHKIAQYLTGEQAQTERFEKHGWGPSNKVAQSSDAVKANIALSALAAQGAYAIPQGNIHGSWWDISKVGPTAAREAELNDVAALQAGLDLYTEQINALFAMTEDQLRAWSLIGSICGTSWDTDIAMTETSENVWESAPITLNAGEEFKARMGASWDVNMGVGGAWDGANVVVETTGTYVVKVTVTKSDTNVKGDVIGSIELIAQ